MVSGGQINCHYIPIHWKYVGVYGCGYWFAATVFKSPACVVVSKLGMYRDRISFIMYIVCTRSLGDVSNTVQYLRITYVRVAQKTINTKQWDWDDGM
jgi:hypothetical protein